MTLPKDPKKQKIYKANLSKACTKPKTETWHKAMDAVFSDATRNKKISNAQTKQWKNPTYKEKHSKRMKKMWDNSETKNKIIATMNTPENIKKISEATKKALAKPETHAKLVKKIHEFTNTPEFKNNSISCRLRRLGFAL